MDHSSINVEEIAKDVLIRSVIFFTVIALYDLWRVLSAEA